jgi:hypothetical protein
MLGRPLSGEREAEAFLPHDMPVSPLITRSPVARMWVQSIATAHARQFVRAQPQLLRPLPCSYTLRDLSHGFPCILQGALCIAQGLEPEIERLVQGHGAELGRERSAAAAERAQVRPRLSVECDLNDLQPKRVACLQPKRIACSHGHR